MHSNWQEHLPDGFSPQSRVWIFQSNRTFTEQEERELNEQLYQFYIQWQSHGVSVKGWAGLLFKRFVLVIADDTTNHVGGCSTDGMVRIIKSFERQYQVDFFNRLLLAFLVDGKIEALPMQQISYALEKGYLETDSCLFNPDVHTLDELRHNWLQALDKSWLWPRLLKQASVKQAN